MESWRGVTIRSVASQAYSYTYLSTYSPPYFLLYVWQYTCTSLVQYAIFLASNSWVHKEVQLCIFYAVLLAVWLTVLLYILYGNHTSNR
jgi:hypothetical protein